MHREVVLFGGFFLEHFHVHLHSPFNPWLPTAPALSALSQLLKYIHTQIMPVPISVMMQHDVYDFEQVNGHLIPVDTAESKNPGLSSTTRSVVWVLILFVMLEAMCSFAGHVEESYLLNDKAAHLRTREYPPPEFSMSADADLPTTETTVSSDTTPFSQLELNITASITPVDPLTRWFFDFQIVEWMDSDNLLQGLGSAKVRSGNRKRVIMALPVRAMRMLTWWLVPV